jgi:ribulose-bisphosphate carboxylase large chain
MKFFVDKVKTSEYYIATYEITSNTNLKEAAWDLALGQSVGNPNMRNSYETEELFARHSCLIIGNEEQLSIDKQGLVKIAFPVINTDWETDGISHLLCQLMGGHVDIDVIRECRLVKLELPKSVTKHFLGPKYGLSGIRKLTKQYDKPLLGAIVKPKIGISADTLLDIVKQLVDGGVDFIKEDEIMSNPIFCPLDTRVDLISNYLAKQSRKIVYCHTINCDPHILVDRVKRVHELGGVGVHINVYSGLGSYNSIRKLDLPLYLHFQKSGDRVFTCRENRYSISWTVICQLATLMGVDTIQTGMIGGYSNDDPKEIKECLRILHEGNTLPALSCGMHPGLVDHVTDLIGVDYLANVGGAIHSHDGGTLAGTKAMRQSIDKDYGNEYITAINQYGKV